MERPDVDYEREVIKGETAQRFLSDPYMAEILAEIDQTYYAGWKTSQEVEVRELLHAKARALEDIKTALGAYVQNGILAKREIDAR